MNLCILTLACHYGVVTIIFFNSAVESESTPSISIVY